MITATRYHDFSAGHRVVGHEGKCQHLHGHNYRVHFTLATARRDGFRHLDEVGRVLDFGVIKRVLCQWLEEQWDHRMLLWEKDPLLPLLRPHDPEGVVTVPFNPTAENMANYLMSVVCPTLLEGSGVRAVSIRVEETRKCSAEVVCTH